jgi:antitoxin PrlF
MLTVLDFESTLTDRYQTTVPEPVRRALHLCKRDKILYKIQGDGAVLISRSKGGDDEDPVVGAFLNFLAQDMQTQPERLQTLGIDLQEMLRGLVREVEVDLVSPLNVADE